MKENKRFPEGLYDLVQKSIAEMRDVPELVEPTVEQKKWVKQQLRGWTCEQ
jgi:hypothetical protein